MTKIAIVGAGIMGANHARVLRTIPDAEVTAVVDPNAERGMRLAEVMGAKYLPDARDVGALAEAAVIAGPSEQHASIGVPLLRAGVDLLVEKPLATDVEGAHALVDAAREHDRLLMVGHIERFNPAVLELDRLVADPLHLEFTRMGPFTPRVTSDVVLDLMIHDLDLALSLAGSDVTDVHGVGRAVRSDTVDIASVLLSFANGVTAAITASRVGQPKVRRIELTQRENFVMVDLVRQDVTIHRVDHNEFLSDKGTRYRQTGLVEIPFLEHRGEPLALELEHFLHCVRTRSVPRITGEQGLRVLELALQARAAFAVRS
jgi:predicted dehydrogenase